MIGIFIWVMIKIVMGTGDQIHRFPLSYAFTPDFKQKYPIKVSFNQSETIAPFQTDALHIYNLNLTMNVETTNSDQPQSVIIGLKQPSTFLYAIQSTFKVPPHQIEFGKEEYLELLINDNNFVESPDYFVNGDKFSIQVLYNYGQSLSISDQVCYLADHSEIYFDEIFIRQTLNSLEPHNQIDFNFNEEENTIELNGKLENFPKIKLKRGNSLFQLTINHKRLNYLPRKQNDSEGANIIGFHALKSFSKFEMDHESIVFKRTSQFYQLYLFMGYFVILTLFMLYLFRGNLFETMRFVRNVLKWVIFQNPQSRLQVLRTELQ